jgi:hypothetical protein
LANRALKRGCITTSTVMHRKMWLTMAWMRRRGRRLARPVRRVAQMLMGAALRWSDYVKDAQRTTATATPTGATACRTAKRMRTVRAWAKSGFVAYVAAFTRIAGRRRAHETFGNEVVFGATEMKNTKSPARSKPRGAFLRAISVRGHLALETRAGSTRTG